MPNTEPLEVSEVDLILEFYPSVNESINQYEQSPEFDKFYQPKEINVYVNDCWMAGWNDKGEVNSMSELKMPANSGAEVLEIELDGESGLIIIGGFEVLNRIKNLLSTNLWMDENN
jgi:hypothetical protein